MKTVSTTIICDSCGKDLFPKVSHYPHNFILQVSCVDVSLRYDIVYAVYKHKIIEDDLYFCGLDCMTKYGKDK